MAIVTHVLGDCPGCGAKNSYGNVMIPGGEYVYRGCEQCKYSCEVYLPPVQKKVVYLDQFLLSGAFRGNDRRFVDAVKRVSKASALQLLVAPYSSVHEDETHLWRGHAGLGLSYEQLMTFIKQTSRGSEFKSSLEVEKSQIIKGFQAFLEGGPAVYSLDERDAIRGNTHVWDDYFRVEVGRYMGDVEEIRRLKMQAVQMLVDVFDEWRQSHNSFEQDVALETADAGRGYMEAYLHLIARVAGGDFAAIWNGPATSMVVESMRYCLPRETPPDEVMAKCLEFFASEHFAQLPSEWLSARIYATLKKLVKGGAYPDRETARQRLSGVFYDVKHIATYAPYCDAFFMDQAMADLVSQPTVGLEQRYGTRVFSLNNLDEFTAWVDDLERRMTADHIEGLKTAYPFLSVP